MRRMIRSSISVSSDRFTNGSTSCSRVLIGWQKGAVPLFQMLAAKTGYGPFLRSRNRHPFDDVRDHRLGGEPMARRVRPEPDAMAEDVLRQILDVLRVDFRTPADQ